MGARELSIFRQKMYHTTISLQQHILFVDSCPDHSGMFVCVCREGLSSLGEVHSVGEESALFRQKGRGDPFFQPRKSKYKHFGNFKFYATLRKISRFCQFFADFG
jgi:hypothetical protein